MRDNGFPSMSVCFPHSTTTDANNLTKTKRHPRTLLSSRNARTNLPSNNNKFVAFSRPGDPIQSPPNQFLDVAQKRAVRSARSRDGLLWWQFRAAEARKCPLHKSEVQTGNSGSCDFKNWMEPCAKPATRRSVGF